KLLEANSTYTKHSSNTVNIMEEISLHSSYTMTPSHGKRAVLISSSPRWTHAMDGRTHAGPRPAAPVPPARRNGRLVASLSSAARARCALPIRAEEPRYLWGRWQPPPGLRCAALV